MSGIQQSKDDLARHLTEQIEFLERSAEHYDQGLFNESKRMATHIRVLLHDTGRSKSLLGQLGLKEIAFFDGGDLPIKENIVPTAGLTVLHYKDGAACWDPKYTVEDRPSPHLRTFESWWTRPVLVDDEKLEMSRHDLILAVVNQDGGAHVDPDIERTYARLSRQNSIGWVSFQGEVQIPVLGIEFASVRQITWEVLRSVHESQQKPNEDPPLYRSIHAPCPCGSGKPSWRCHGMPA